MDVVSANAGRQPLRPWLCCAGFSTDALTTGSLPDSVLRLVLDTISDGALVPLMPTARSYCAIRLWNGLSARCRSACADRLGGRIASLPAGRDGAMPPCRSDIVESIAPRAGRRCRATRPPAGPGRSVGQRHAGPLRATGGAVRGAVVVLGDITERKRAEERLRADERLLQSVLDNAPGRIAIKDRDGRLLLVNRRFAELAGRTPWDVIGPTDRALFSGPGPDQVRANDRLALAGGRLMQFEEVLDLPDGPRTFLSVKVPAENVGFPGRVLFEFTTDITERKRAEELVRCVPSG